MRIASLLADGVPPPLKATLSARIENLFMKKIKQSLAWKIWLFSVIGLGSFLMYIAFFMKTKPTFLIILFYIFILIQYPLTEYLKRRKIEKGKKEFGITGDVSLDQLESMRIEKDYQEKISKRFKL